MSNFCEMAAARLHAWNTTQHQERVEQDMLRDCNTESYYTDEYPDKIARFLKAMSTFASSRHCSEARSYAITLGSLEAGDSAYRAADDA